MNSTGFDLDLFFSPYLLYFPRDKSLHHNPPPFIIHIATAGGNIPEIICENINHSRTRKHLKNLPDSFLLEAQESDNLTEIFATKRQINSEFDKPSYMKDFISYAERGCFSFDRTNIHDPTNNKYHLVAYPKIMDESPHKYIKIIDEIFNYKTTHNSAEIKKWWGRLAKTQSVELKFRGDELLILDTMSSAIIRLNSNKVS